MKNTMNHLSRMKEALQRKAQEVPAQQRELGPYQTLVMRRVSELLKMVQLPLAYRGVLGQCITAISNFSDLQCRQLLESCAHFGRQCESDLNAIDSQTQRTNDNSRNDGLRENDAS